MHAAVALLAGQCIAGLFARMPVAQLRYTRHNAMRGCVSSRLVANLHAAANLKFALCLPTLLSTQSEVGFMNFSRRRFIGAIAACSAGTMAPRGFAEVQLGAKPALLPRAMASLESHWQSVVNRDVIGMVDFGMASHEPRFHLVDISKGMVLATHLVAHGRGSDPANDGWVERFSNDPGSNASCSGSFVTGDTYAGKHGRSRRLIGLDGSNNLANSRGIVIHAASYVDTGTAQSQGRIGRSQGCFAVSHTDIDQVLSLLGPGRLLFAWK